VLRPKKTTNVGTNFYVPVDGHPRSERALTLVEREPVTQPLVCGGCVAEATEQSHGITLFHHRSTASS
jgi:hypothetical protein